jgi:hypothetical protein
LKPKCTFISGVNQNCTHRYNGSGCKQRRGRICGKKRRVVINMGNDRRVEPAKRVESHPKGGPGPVREDEQCRDVSKLKATAKNRSQ